MFSDCLLLSDDDDDVIIEFIIWENPKKFPFTANSAYT